MKTMHRLGLYALATFVLATGCNKETAAPADGPGAKEPAAEAPKAAEPAPVEAPKPAEPAPVAKAPEPAPTAPAPVTPPGVENPALKDPALALEKAPELYKVKFHTTVGDITLEVHRDWAPQGADRFFNLVKIGFFTDIELFRVVPGFMAQFGIHGDPAISKAWRDASITDDPVKESNKRGYLTFATRGRDTRTTQMFINLVDNPNLDRMGFSPIGKIAEGQDVLDKVYGGYGEGAPGGNGPNQMRVQFEGNKYLKAEFPKLDSILSATIVP